MSGAQTGMPWAPVKDRVNVQGEVVKLLFESGDDGYRGYLVRVTRNAEGQVVEHAAPEVWVGIMPPFSPGTSVQATGVYEPDRKDPTRLRLKVETSIPLNPQTIDGVIAYLAGGMIPDVGPERARLIVGHFGMDTIEVLDKAPWRLTEVRGIGEKIAANIQKAWKEHRVIGAVMMFLQGFEVSPGLATRIFKVFGQRALEMVQNHPYELAIQVHSIGFKTADAIARKAGIASDSIDRAKAALVHVLHDAAGSDGHLFLRRAELLGAAMKLLVDFDETRLQQALDALVEEKRLVIDPMGLGDQVFLQHVHAYECRVARRVAHLLRAQVRAGAGNLDPDAAIAAFEAKAGVTLAPAQRAAVEMAARSKIVVITGGPGVGKTTIVRALLTMFETAALQVRLAAPTGRAAKRIKETTGNPSASTIHRLLGRDPETKRIPLYKLTNPLPQCDVLLVDEASMIDLELADHLLHALPTSARLVVVGDVDQLPSVGAGAVLRDLIQSGVLPVARLTQIFRQAEGSLIVENAHRINAGDWPEEAGSPDGEFYVVERPDREPSGDGARTTADVVAAVVTRRIPQRFGFNPKTDVQVLVPMNNGPVGTIELNTRLQALLNPPGPPEIVKRLTKATVIYRTGDKVMQVVNDYEKDVFNGDVGFIESVTRGEKGASLVVDFDGHKVTYDEKEVATSLRLAYAVSIHKCVHPDTLVETTEGLLPIREIHASGVIATPDGARAYQRKVVNPPGPLLTLTTRDGYELTVTPEHGLDVWRDGVYRRVEARDLQPDDLVRLRLGAQVEPPKAPPLPQPPATSTRAQRYSFPRRLTADVAEFFGLMVADGIIFHGGIRLVKRHPSVIRRFAALCRKLFGARPRRISVLGTPGYEVCSVQIAEWCRLVGGMSPHQKAIPSCILRAPLRLQAAFLRGLFEDGSAHLKSGKLDHVQWINKSREMASMVQTMLLRFGIIAGRGTHRRRARVEVYGQHAKRFATLVGFIADFKRRRLALAAGNETRYLIPVTPEEAVELRRVAPRIFSSKNANNAKRRGRISRHIAKALVGAATLPWLRARLDFHHTPLRRIVSSTGPSMCVTVSEGHRFLQNGFSGWNSQGSEYPCVVVVMTTSAWVMLSRNLLYTAVTRGKKLVVLVTSPRALSTSLAETRREERKTLLAARIARAVEAQGAMP